MKIKGIEVKKPIEVQTTIYECPYCPKKFMNKNSYYNHISKNYCWGFEIKPLLKNILSKGENK